MKMQKDPALTFKVSQLIPLVDSTYLLHSHPTLFIDSVPTDLLRYGRDGWRLNWTIINRITIDLRIELANYKQQYLPVNLPNSSNISSLPFDFGILPTKRRRFGTLMLIFKHFPVLISKLSSCGL